MQSDFSSYDQVRNILIELSYDGRRYHGWQVQKNAVSVQEVFQNALYKILKTRVDIKGCSRTDSGVHANVYYANFKVCHTIPCDGLVAALNRHLPMDIVVLSAREVPINFHARYSCTSKEYVYKIWNSKLRNPFLDGLVFHYWYPLDIDKLNKAANHYIGKHDFTSFCTPDSRKKGNMVRTVENFDIKKENNIVLMTVRADGFLYNMVRIMVGTLLRVAQGKIDENDIKDIIQKKNRLAAGPTARPCGLYLNRVFYEEL